MNDRESKAGLALEESIQMLAEALGGIEAPPALILAARYLMIEHDRAALPDWVAALANGNLHNWQELRALALEEMEHDDG